MGRPKSTNPKVQQTLRLDADILRAFKSTGRGWQTRINKALRDHIDEAPEITKEQLERADCYVNGKLVKKGKRDAK